MGPKEASSMRREVGGRGGASSHLGVEEPPLRKVSLDRWMAMESERKANGRGIT